MKKNIFLKSTLRQPALSIFLILLIGFVSFTFVSRAMEYLIIQRETARLSGYYRSIGSLKPNDPENDNVAEGAALISGSRFLSFEDRRRYCSGVIQGLLNSDVNGNTSDYTGNIFGKGINICDVFIYGEPQNITYSNEKRIRRLKIEFKVDMVVAGYPEYVSEGKVINLVYQLADGETINNSPINGIEVGQRYFIKAMYDNAFDQNLTFEEHDTWLYVSSSVGSTNNWKSHDSFLVIKPLNDALWFLPVEPGDVLNFDAPDLSEIYSDIELVKENQSTVFVTTSADMSAMPSVQQESRGYYITDGRLLNRDDNINAAPVCIISREFSDRRGLTIGDSLTITFRDLKNYFIKWTGMLGYIQRGEDADSWRDYPTYQQEFEIVGIYNVLDVGSTHYGTLVFIPDSCLPDGFGIDASSQIQPYYYSFVLNSTREQEAFIAEYKEPLNELGYSLSFIKNNAGNFWESIDPLKRSSMINALVFGVVLTLTLTLEVFLYLWRSRKEFSILRALGVPIGKTVRHVTASNFFVCALGMIVGGIASWNYTLGKAAETLASIVKPDGVEANASPSVVWLFVLCLVLFILLLFFTLFGASLLAKQPVLELLQGYANKTGAKQNIQIKPNSTEPKGNEIYKGNMVYEFKLNATPVSHANKLTTAPVRYMLRHIRRQTLKSVLVAAIALFFALALNWMNKSIDHSKTEIDRMYDTTVVEAEIFQADPTYLSDPGIIYNRTVNGVMGSGFIQNAFLVAGSEWYNVEPEMRPEWEEYVARRIAEGYGSVNRWADSYISTLSLLAPNQPEQFLSEVDVEYADGWSQELFSEDWSNARLESENIPIIVSIEVLDILNKEMDINPGDLFHMYSRDIKERLAFRIAGYYSGTFTMYKVMKTVLAPLSAIELLYDEVNYAVARFSVYPAKNRELSDFYDEMVKRVSNQFAGTTELEFILWDEELKQVIDPLEKNLALMSVLYPVTIAASVLIAAGLAVLLILQGAKEAAILRVLGNTKKTVRFILCGEIMVLCFLGLVIGLIVFSAINWNPSAGFTTNSMICAGLYFCGSLFGSVFTAILVTNRMPIAMLQVKE